MKPLAMNMKRRRSSVFFSVCLPLVLLLLLDIKLRIFPLDSSGVPETHYFQGSDKRDCRRPGVYPRLQGGLGNQLFIMSAAAVVAMKTNRCIVVNSKQTGVYSYGAPQPVFWHTVFHSDVFHKASKYAELNAVGISEEGFLEAQYDGFEKWKDLAKGIHVDGTFLDFRLFSSEREMFRSIYFPTSEVQRWVNDAASRLGLIGAQSHPQNPKHGPTTKLSSVKPSGRPKPAKYLSPCGYPPTPCEAVVSRLECHHSETCEKNYAVQIRLSDRSTHKDFLLESELEVLREFIQSTLAEGNHIVVFSNDPDRAKAILSYHKEIPVEVLDAHLKFSAEINVVDFFLMSQYFGTHILSGSSFQLWAIFLSPLHRVHVKSLFKTEDFGFAASMKNSHVVWSNGTV